MARLYSFYFRSFASSNVTEKNMILFSQSDPHRHPPLAKKCQNDEDWLWLISLHVGQESNLFQCCHMYWEYLTSRTHTAWSCQVQFSSAPVKMLRLRAWKSYVRVLPRQLIGPHPLLCNSTFCAVPTFVWLTICTQAFCALNVDSLSDWPWPQIVCALNEGRPFVLLTMAPDRACFEWR